MSEGLGGKRRTRQRETAPRWRKQMSIAAFAALLATAAWSFIGVDWPAKAGRGAPSDALITSVHGKGWSAIQANIESTDRAVDFIESLHLIRQHGNSRRREEAKQALTLLRSRLDTGHSDSQVAETHDPYCSFTMQVIAVLRSVAVSGARQQREQALMSIGRIRKHLR